MTQGQTKTFNVTFTRTTATLNAYTGGQLTWTDGTHNVRIPMVVRPLALAAPTQVSGNGGAINYNVTFGYNGPSPPTPRGLVPAATTSDTVNAMTRRTPLFRAARAPVLAVTIPAGTTYARFSLFNANVDARRAISTCTSTRAPRWSVRARADVGRGREPARPGRGNYTVWVHGFAVPGTANFTLFDWHARSTAAGNMTRQRTGLGHARRHRDDQPDLQRPGAGHEVPGLGRYSGSRGPAQSHHRARRHAVARALKTPTRLAAPASLVVVASRAVKVGRRP